MIRYLPFFALVFILSPKLQAQDTLKIVSWNVFLRPALLADDQNKRVDHIFKALLETSADVICLQELFSSAHRKRLRDSLKGTYPHYVNPGRRGFRLSSGLMIFSKHKILDNDITYFTNKSGVDKLAWKGVQSALIRYKDTTLLILNTHLQSGDKPEKQLVRSYQYRRFTTVLKTYFPYDYWVAGDMNTSVDSAGFEHLQSACKAVEAVSIQSELKHTGNFRDNGFYKNDSAQPTRIDFVLKKESSNWKNSSLRFTRPKITIKKGQDLYLSDHAMVTSDFIRPRN